ncbi:MAG: 4-(cytidine 5'-diphospho)-2-C-methyl-D-erythritol kinase [Propionibacteriaceae bacterium]|nr:4-(cytidine 5'-diphospho)-2-C-methyl-D-erythritol kinase [Propionibacteriaceae bacterium]
MSVAQSWDDLAQVRVRVPAKINLALCVGGVRADGYHELATIFQAVSLYDDVTAISAEGDVSCEMRGAEAHKVGQGSDNLACRAASLVKREYSVSEGVRLIIDKQIPVAGGMAGGSADAAGALLACARLWDLKVSANDLLDLAGRLGADVPFALMGGCAVGLGRGEKLTPALCRGQFHWVLAIAGRELSTPEVFRRFDHLPTPTGWSEVPQVPAELMMALASGDSSRVGGLLVNDLSAASCSLLPQLHATMTAGRDAGAQGVIISGSGPTVAFLADDEASATDLAVALSSQGVAREVRIVTGPVPGATVQPA